jgi:hypothetical protein
MKPNVILKHEFVEFIPEELEEKTVYISIPYASATHKCCCGCGEKVVTPITPTDWQLIFDGETISLDPSIGSWSSKCKSHYWIRKNRTKWAENWTSEEINKARTFDKIAKENYFKKSKSDPKI